VGTISWKKAITLLAKYECSSKFGIDVVCHYKDEFKLDTKGRRHEIPAVVRLRTYKRQSARTAKFSRKNIYIRDNMQCQYCGDKLDYDKFTYDHVVPRSKWNYAKGETPTTWENIVAACYRCNLRKKNKTPKEAGMKLRSQPRKMSANHYVKGVSPYGKIPMEWLDYLPNIYKEIARNSV